MNIENHPEVKSPKVGILLVNLGTPDALDYFSMRRYLGEFLSDPRVIEVPKWLWFPILQGPILTFRPKRSAAAYSKIWNNDLNESPLLTFTRNQTEKLHAMRKKQEILIDFAMRYGNPSIRTVIDKMFEKGVRRLLVVPLYPQYSAATTGSVVDEVGASLKKMRWQPTVRFVPPFYDDVFYIEQLADHFTKQLTNLNRKPEVLVASFHGVPKSYLIKGDPYHCQCQKTARLLREKIDWPADRFYVAFQSRFGPVEWLKPYVEELVISLAQSGVKHLGVISPAFYSDCVETLEEISLELKETFLEAGGQEFSSFECLNDSSHGMAIMNRLIDTELSGWI